MNFLESEFSADPSVATDWVAASSSLMTSSGDERVASRELFGVTLVTLALETEAEEWTLRGVKYSRGVVTKDEADIEDVSSRSGV